MYPSRCTPPQTTRENRTSTRPEVPDATTILKIARALGPAVIEQRHRQVAEVPNPAAGCATAQLPRSFLHRKVV